MSTQSITLSKTKTIVHCCIISALIAMTIGLLSNVDMHAFILNILDWDSI